MTFEKFREIKAKPRTCGYVLIKRESKKIELAEHALEKAEYSLVRSGQSIKEFAEYNLKELGEMYK